MSQKTTDERWMRLALTQGARGLGRCWPNPSVGAVIVKHQQILGAAHTAFGGRPHAETLALEAAGSNAQGATLYVTLEPCSHYGQTPPCVEAIIAAGISRVVIGQRDPNPQVNGKGIAALQQAGVAVVEDICAMEAAELHRGFVLTQTLQRPLVTMKIASSLDAAVVNGRGESQWITGEAARAHGHHLRATHDAILTGIGTVLRDDPTLTCRLPGLESASPVRVIADSKLRVPLESTLVKTAKQTPTWVLCCTEALTFEAEKVKALKDAGVMILPCALDAQDRLDAKAMLTLLAKHGITRLLVEAGPTFQTALVQKKLVDEIYWYRAPKLLGRGAKLALTPEIERPLAALMAWQCVTRQALGDDILEVYKL